MPHTKLRYLNKLAINALALLFIANTAYAQCTAPQFSSVPNIAKSNHPTATIKLNLNPSIATIDIPSEFASITVSPSGSLGFKSASRNAKGIVIYESAKDYYLPEETNIYDFYKTLFTSPKGDYCDYLEPYDLHNQAYRYHLQKDGGEIYSFGSDSIHSFYILNKRQPKLIVSGEIHNITRSEFESILQSIEIKN